MEREVKVFDGTFLDYALKIAGDARLYVEAKSVGGNLDYKSSSPRPSLREQRRRALVRADERTPLRAGGRSAHGSRCGRAVDRGDRGLWLRGLDVLVVVVAVAQNHDAVIADVELRGADVPGARSGWSRSIHVMAPRRSGSRSKGPMRQTRHNHRSALSGL